MNPELELLKQMAHTIAMQFGKDCEVIIHDLTSKDMDHTIVHIENGHVTNGKLGDGPSAVVLETLHRDRKTSRTTMHIRSRHPTAKS